MKYLSFTLLLFACLGYGQQNKTANLGGYYQASLVCAKYEHTEIFFSANSKGYEEKCVDDIAFVTQKEWLSVLKRLRDLEASSYVPTCGWQWYVPNYSFVPVNVNGAPVSGGGAITGSGDLDNLNPIFIPKQH